MVLLQPFFVHEFVLEQRDLLQDLAMLKKYTRPLPDETKVQDSFLPPPSRLAHPVS